MSAAVAGQGQLEAAAGRAEVASIRAAMPRTRAGAVTSQGDFAQRSRWCAPTIRRCSDRCHGGRALRQLQLLCRVCRSRAAASRLSATRATPTTASPPITPPTYRAVICRRASMCWRRRICLSLRRAHADCHSRMKAGRCCRSFTTWRRGRLWRSTRRTTARRILPAASASSPPPARRSSPTTWAISMSRSFRMASSRRRSMPSKRKGWRISPPPATMGSVLPEHRAELSPRRSTSGSNAGEHLLNFDRTGATNTTSLPMTIPPIPPGDFIAVVVEWDQPYVTGAPASGGATSSIDLCITGGTGGVTITDYDGNAASCTGPNAVGVRSLSDHDHRQPGQCRWQTPRSRI